MPGVDAGRGQRRHLDVVGDPLGGQLALGLRGLHVLAVGQHHGPDRGRDQQRPGDLEGPHVLGEDQSGQALDIALGVGLAETGEAVQLGVGDPGDHQHAEAEAAERGGEPLALQLLLQRVRAGHADQHHHEQEEHHDRAGVDHDLHHTQEHRALGHVTDRQGEHGGGQAERAVHRLAHQQRPERAADGDHREHPELDGLTGGGRARHGREVQRGGGAHDWASFSRSVGS